jgi:hypothetical protein
MRTVERGISGHVYQDSCLEFFFIPMPDTDARYINFEVNSAGAVHVGIGKDRLSRQILTENELREVKISPFSSDASNNNDVEATFVSWGYILHIPISFLQLHFSGFQLSPKATMRGNFYKCGDLTPAPHWGAWSPVHTPQPDFHQPEYFGELRVS